MYQGWTNRQTWAAAVWLNNHEALYQETWTMARRFASKGKPASHYEEYLKGVFLTLKAMSLADTRLSGMLDDIGHVGRVDFGQLAATIMHEAREG